MMRASVVFESLWFSQAVGLGAPPSLNGLAGAASARFQSRPAA